MTSEEHDSPEPTLDDCAQATIDSMTKMLEYVENVVAPRIFAQEPHGPRRTALVFLFNGVCSLLLGMVGAEYPRAFRALAALARSVWEHSVDFSVVFQDTTQELAKRYIYYREIELWNRAKRIQSARADHGLARDASVDRYLKDGDVKDRVKNALAECWPAVDFSAVESIRSWDGQGISERAFGTNKEYAAFHMDRYGAWSSSVHPSLTQIMAVPAVYLKHTAAEALHYAFNLLIEMVRLLAQEFEFDQAAWDKGAKIVDDWARRAQVEAPDEPEDSTS